MNSAATSLISAHQLSQRHILQLFLLAQKIEKSPKQYQAALSGKRIALVFLEESTRTHSSFSAAAQLLGASLVSAMGGTIAKKTESPAQLIQNIAATGVDALVLRTPFSLAGVPIQQANLPIINAGDGSCEHPTQALLDAYFLWKTYGADLAKKRVLVVGDIRRSRVFHSLPPVLAALGVQHIEVCAPGPMAPATVLARAGARFAPSLDAALQNADIVYALRPQNERGGDNCLPQASHYARDFCLHPRMLPQSAIVMSPGPCRPGQDLSQDMLADSRFCGYQQVRGGVYLRAALLLQLLGAS